MNFVDLMGVWWVPYLHAVIYQGLFSTLIGFGYLNILQKKLDKDAIGTFFGVSNSMNSVGGFLAPLVGGYIYGYNNFVPYCASSALAIVVGLIYLSIPTEKPELPMVDSKPLLHENPTNHRMPAAHTDPAMSLGRRPGLPLVGSRASLTTRGLPRSLHSSGSLTSLTGYNSMSKLAAMDLEMYAAHKTKQERAKGGLKNTMTSSPSFAGEFGNRLGRNQFSLDNLTTMTRQTTS